MSLLANQKCVPCRGRIPPLRGPDLAAWSDRLGNEWEVVDEHHLEKSYKLANFREALRLTLAIGELAEDVNHHPDIHLTWGQVRLELWTHKIDGLTETDFVFAAKVDRLRDRLAADCAEEEPQS